MLAKLKEKGAAEEGAAAGAALGLEAEAAAGAAAKEKEKPVELGAGVDVVDERDPKLRGAPKLKDGSAGAAEEAAAGAVAGVGRERGAPNCGAAEPVTALDVANENVKLGGMVKLRGGFVEGAAGSGAGSGTGTLSS